MDDDPISPKSVISNQRGSFLLMTSMTLVMVMGFVALGVEVGRWYIVKAELSKSVDAIALLSAQHLSNPQLSVQELVQEMGKANFQPGFLGTDGPAEFSEEIQADGLILVKGQTSVVNVMAPVLETSATQNTYDRMTVASLGAAQQQSVEIVLVLDRSASMRSTFNPLDRTSRLEQPPIEDLKTAAIHFLEFFDVTQEYDHMALITFGTEVKVNVAMASHFVEPMSAVIEDMEADGSTNTEDALSQALGPEGFSEFLTVGDEHRAQQYLILFSDGMPTAFRAPEDSPFMRDGQVVDDVVVAANFSAGASLFDASSGEALGILQYQTGDGLPKDRTKCVEGTPPIPYLTTKWGVLEDPVYGSHTYEPLMDSDLEACKLNTSTMANYTQFTARQMALDHAQALKNQGIVIFTVGLGVIDRAFLSTVSSGQDFEFYTSDPSGLTQIFQQIATNIKLRLVR